MALTEASQTGNELSVFTYTTTLLDEDLNALSLASIDTAKLTLWDVETGDIINSRNAQDVKNLSQVTIATTGGLLTWSALAADSPIVGTPFPGEKETHIAMFDIVYSTTKRLTHKLTLYVNQISKLP